MRTILYLTSFIIQWHMQIALQPAKIKLLSPKGIMFTIKDDDYQFVGGNYTIKTQSAYDVPNSWTFDIKTKTGNAWIHRNRKVDVYPGNTVHYDLYARSLYDSKGGPVYDELFRQSYTIPENNVYTSTSPVYGGRTESTTLSTDIENGDNNNPESNQRDAGTDTDDDGDDIVPVIIGVTLGVALAICIGIIVICFCRKNASSQSGGIKTKQQQSNANENKQNEITDADRRNIRQKLPEIPKRIATDQTKSKQDPHMRMQAYDKSEFIYDEPTYEQYVEPNSVPSESEKGPKYEPLSPNRVLPQTPYEKLENPHAYVELVE